MAISAIRTVIIYIFIVVAVRLMGKRQIADLQPIELVVTLMISDLAAVPMQDGALPLSSGLIPILVLVALELIVSALNMKIPLLSKLLNGSPIVVIRDGKVDQKAMEKLRLTVEDLFESMREQNQFDLKNVQYALAEVDGTITFFPYAEYQPATRLDVRTDISDNGIPLVVVSDGKLCDWALQVCELSRNWVENTLKSNNCDIKQVFLLTADKAGNYYLVRKEDG